MKKVNCYIKPSQIHGVGLFALEDIKAGDIIEVELAKCDYSRDYKEWAKYLKETTKKSFALTQGYCVINHSGEPNVFRGDEIIIIAKTDIKKGEEIVENYYDLPDNHNPFYNRFEEIYFDIINNQL